MTDNDLNRLVQEKHSFEEIRRLLGLEQSGYHIMEGGSVDMATYRFTVGNRYLFLEMNQSQSNNIVSRAFFVDHQPGSPQHDIGDTNEVKKPK